MTSLFQEIEKRLDHVSFHTPGHSGGVCVFPESAEGSGFPRGDVDQGMTASFGSEVAGLCAGTSGIAAEPSEIGAKISEFGARATGLSAETSEFGKRNSEYKTGISGVGKRKSGLDVETTEFGAKTTAIGDGIPGFGVGMFGSGRDFASGARFGAGSDPRYDVTELPYTDNLLEANGAIRTLERRWAAAYRADDCLLFTNGATGAVFAAVAAAEGKLAVVGGAHVSVYRAAALMKKPTVFLKNLGTLEKYLSCAARGEEEPLGAIFVTAPSYLGKTEPLSDYRAIAERSGAKLIVDSAHGSHFAFFDKFPVPATEYGDMVIYSLHKTLPVLTGGAALAVRSAFSDAAREARRATHTTSPSYPILLSAEGALDRLKTAPENYGETFALLDLFEKDLETSAFRLLPSDDRTRVTLVSPFDGLAVSAALAARGIYAEYAFDNKLVLIVTPYNKQNLSYLAFCLKELRGLIRFSGSEPPPPVPEQRELRIFAEKTERVPLCRAEGRTLAAPVGLYPPGVPNYFPGDALDQEAVAFCDKNRSRLFGLAETGVLVVK